MSAIVNPDLYPDLPVAHDDGSFVSEKISRIVELVREYGDGSLDVRWIHPRDRREDDAAFAVVEMCKDGIIRTAFLIKSEEEFDERVLARIYAADQGRHGSPVDRIEAHNRAVRDLRYREEMEHQEELKDLSAFLIRTPKHRVTLPNGKTVNL